MDRTQALTAPTEKEDLPAKDEAPLATRGSRSVAPACRTQCTSRAEQSQPEREVANLREVAVPLWKVAPDTEREDKESTDNGVGPVCCQSRATEEAGAAA